MMMKVMKVLFLATVLIQLHFDFSNAETLKRVIFEKTLADDRSAICLDGSPAGYYVDDVANSEGWAIYLEGGGLCLEPFDCIQRTKSKLGSSKYWAESFSDTTNVLSDGPENPFANFSKVWVPYCSGDMYTGSSIKNHLLAGLSTCGFNIVDTVLEHLYNTTSFAGAKQLLLSGGSAGGFGAFHLADYVGERSRALGVPLTRYKVSPQAGYFFAKDVCLFETFALGSKVPFDLFATAYVSLIQNAYIPPACAAALGDKLKHRCWDVNVLQNYITTPLFVAQNLADSNQINDELFCPGSVCNNHYKENSTAAKYMQDFVNKSTVSLTNHIKLHPKNGLFAPSCFKHTEDLCMTIGPQIHGVSYGQSLGSWYFEDNKYPTVLMDHCTTSAVCNRNCGSGCGDS